MRKNDKDEVIITRVKASEIFFILSAARVKLTGKMQTMANKYWTEFEDILDLNPSKQEKTRERY